MSNDNEDYQNDEKMLEEYNKLIEKNGTDSELFAKRGMCYYSLGKYMEAFTDGVTSARLNPNVTDGLKPIALSLIKMEKYQEARRVIEKAMSMEETNDYWKKLHLEVLEKDTIQFDPMHVFDNWEEKLMSNERTKKYLKDESFKEYLSDYVNNPMLFKSGVKDPKISECLMVLMGVDMNQFLNAQNTKSLWSEAITKEKQRELKKEMDEKGIDVNNDKNESSQEVKDFLKSVTPKKSKPFIPPKNNEERIIEAEKEKEKGNEYYKQKMFQEAIECYNRAMMLDKTNIIYQLNKSAVYYEMKQWRFVIQICSNLINKITDQKRHGRIAFRLANAYLEVKELENAEKYFDIAIKDGINEAKTKYEEVKELIEQEQERKILKGPTMNSDIERYLMHDEVREIIRLINENPNNLKKLRKDPKYRQYIEKMIQLGILQSQT
ncbi:heat shock protein STI1, putative [Entamoeba histolytica HM-1:IMSS-B]|uniref:Heat shock protein STI1, putative n=6 Tax=Entamoeba histolytica TaxID=5759 RepID=C4M579_ENTH1|nr:heat shock protein STI1, putative [Entamoeba histolytica HM-1:IMSS]EMD45858.1 heat shock protein STI1, putative [Entamoeba histolytica KU27]EMH75962.1 heat shock protein STI1, putative [Entamoeba histolytica HM-1:IMSS-B]ENY62374.1 heat shock protein STI1, putative [Entamoeba histolytica HM-1:IMSS-A]GAT96566.1 heat shock protein sti1 putative [Entamoeba histolytica]EAL44710.2 heat shock protein STI1, putative [Entamoeba histolytica HM-1:IMSS]|eukprot:XP_650088.2 heat shock protein STI1, putative [Entamoeba histolytica HM-1:IMSS]